MREQALETQLLEAEEIIADMSRLIDISRNKQLQRKLLKFAEATNALLSEDLTPPPDNMVSAPMPAIRQEQQVRIKRKKKTPKNPGGGMMGYGSDSSHTEEYGPPRKLAPLPKQVTRKSSASGRSAIQNQSANLMASQGVIVEKRGKKVPKKKYESQIKAA